MTRRIWETIDNLYGHLFLHLRGCKHPKLEPEGAIDLPFDGEVVTFFLETCTVCGITLMNEV
jgi:hypothetical protein